MTANVSLSLASFAAQLSADDVPAEVVHHARRCLVDWVGCAVVGSAARESARVRRTLRALDAGEMGTSRIVGTPDLTSAPFAALANGFAAHVLDFDDTFNPRETTVHGSAALWAAILAAGGLQPTSGREAIIAFVAGFEIQTRVALAAGPGQYDNGWHVTGTVGHIGAAAAVARQLGLDSASTLAAIGAGATQAAGMKAVYGSMGKALHPGKAAMDGVLAASLAQHGFTAGIDPIAGHRGFLHLFSPDPDPARAVADLGDRWYLPANGFKAYACGSLTHPAAQALIDLRNDVGFSVTDVASVRATVHDYVLTTTGNPEPASGLDGKFSIYHVLAAALVDGELMPRQFTDERVQDPTLVRLRERIEVHRDPRRTKDSALVAISLTDGRVLERSVEHNLGTPDNPMSDDQLEGKMRGLVGPVLGDATAALLAERCWEVTSLGDVRAIVDATVPERGGCLEDSRPPED